LKLHAADWIVVFGYLGLALAVGLVLSRRAGRSVEQFFLTGRSLPWWVAGTSMVATSFAADTPLFVTALVRDAGIWKNWLWWCYALGGLCGTFLFARWWRRGEVMTKAEVVELRYGGREARALRAALGVLHAGFTNTLTLCWVMLAATKILEVLFAVDKEVGVAVAALLAVSYSALSGIWGVVVTDMIQFAMALVGAFALAWLSWDAIGGHSGLVEAVAAGGSFTADTLRMVPAPGPGGPLDASFWTAAVAAFAVYLGVAWWAVENIDGSSIAVQRIAATRDERHGLLAYLWFNVLHYAVRPWPWIVVALASLVLLPHVEIAASSGGVVTRVDADAVEIATPDGPERVALDSDDADWRPVPLVAVADRVEAGQVVGRTDSEKAYVVMMTRLLPIGLLGLVIASLLAAFMSTVDTHVNLSAAYFVNDIYRRFVRKDATDKHYIRVARITTFVVIAVAGAFTLVAESIRDLFVFFLAFLSGVGPVYVLRWLWWRIRAVTEITAMVASATCTIVVTLVEVPWPLGPLSPGGALSGPGRLVVVVLFSMTCAGISLIAAGRPDPRTLVDFYRKVRPIGWWGPVRALVGQPVTRDAILPVLAGIGGGSALIFGVLFATGDLLVGDAADAAWKLPVILGGALAVRWSLARRVPGASTSS
jgi:Na+/proline symporter